MTSAYISELANSIAITKAGALAAISKMQMAVPTEHIGEQRQRRRFPGIHSSVAVLHRAGLLHFTDKLLFLKRLQEKSPREFNRRIKEWTEAPDAVKIEPMPPMKFGQAEDLTIRCISREEFEAQYG